MKPLPPPKFVHATVPRLLPNGGTVVCLGGGPSLTEADVAYCRGKADLVIAINNAYQLAPWADVLYACDARFWTWHRGVKSFKGLKFSLQKAAAVWSAVGVLKRTGDYGLERKPHGLRTGRNSGYQAINVALHLGATRVLLLGYDMQLTGGRCHWHPPHPNNQPPPVQSFRGAFRMLAPQLAGYGLTVINCSRETALTCFPCQPLEQALPDDGASSQALVECSSHDQVGG